MFGKLFGNKAGEEGNDSESRSRNNEDRGPRNSSAQGHTDGMGPSSSNNLNQKGDRNREPRHVDGFMAFMARGASAQDAEMERKVSISARNLGDGVQKIVMAAKGSGRQSGGQHGEWKSQLLNLLGGGDDDQAGTFSGSESNIDILLENSTCDKFVLRCVENELPPNLIHCLRLLRVLELQHANSQHQRDGGAPQSISTRATAKVSKLLCLLCTDPSVGEQLRPHLFGLLALSGASYPASGVHVASAASSVIVAFSEKCLSTSLVWFLHDRKMIVHMTDDIKELCGMSAVSSSSANSATLCLYGDAAEEAGLWVVALRTVVNLVVHSCNHQCLELLNDFNSANGYHVLCYAIANSSGPHAKKLLELVTVLACCKTDLDSEAGKVDGTDDARSLSEDNQDKENLKLATNPAAFDIIEDLMVRSVPLLKEFDQECGGERPEITSEESLRELSTFSMRTALNVRFGGANTTTTGDFDLAMELLVTTLQMYSDHAKNYDIIEERHSILSYYLLAFPTFEDLSLKVLILKTLEYVLTGVAGTDAIKPLTVATEIFFALCKSLLKGANGIELDSEEEARIYKDLLTDAERMCSTIEKLLEFDSRVAPIMLDGGILSVKLSEVLDFVLQVTDNIAKQDPEMFEADNKIFCQPPEKTALDRVFSAICRVLKLVVSKSGSIISENYAATEDLTGPTNLNVLLVIAITHLGEEASAAALSVFEAKISLETNRDLIRSDVEFVMELLNHYAEMTGRLKGLELFEAKFSQKKGESEESKDEIKISQKKQLLHPYTIIREANIFQMLKNALEASDLAQDTFRMAGGFEAIVRATCCLEGMVSTPENDDAEKTGEDVESCNQALLKLLETSFGLISAGTVKSSHTQGISSNQDVLTDDITTRMFNIPSSSNRQYLNQRGFYFDYACAIFETGILSRDCHASRILDLALTFIDPNLKFQSGRSSQAKGTELLPKAQMLKNPDGTRLLMALAACLPSTESETALSKSALDEMLRLCAPDMVGSSLSQIASCGVCLSITNHRQFGNILENRSHHLYSRFVLLLRRIAAFSMTYMDFVSMLRCVAGPLLRVDSKDTKIRLPVISSSVKTQVAYQVSMDEMMSDSWQTRETDFCNRLETLSIIAERGDRVPRCEMGGDSLNTIAVYMHKTAVEDRLYIMAEEGRLKFLEVECLDIAALGPNGATTAGIQAPSSNSGERIWTPLASSGFTYSLWLRLAKLATDSSTGIISVLDVSSPPSSSSRDYMSVWYDVQEQRFNVLTSASYRNEPIHFAVTPLTQGVWHHILLTYVPPKRPMLSKKALIGLFVDGRSLGAEIKVESVNLPPNSKVHIGVPNPTLATSGYVGGLLPLWELGPTLMLSTVLSGHEATAMYTSGADFQGMFWGDRPQRLSLAATGTAAFAMLAESGEQGSVAGALRRREIPRLEAAGTVTRERGIANGLSQSPDSDSLASLNLLCKVPPDLVLFGFRAAASRSRTPESSLRLVNVARINVSKEDVATDAIVYGRGSVISPFCFADNVQWVGGPSILFPIVNAAQSGRSLALALRLVRESVHRHPPNLEMLQAGGGYKMLAVLLRQKKIMDETVLDQCFAFAVHGFEPGGLEQQQMRDGKPHEHALQSWPNSDRWVFADLDAMKYLLLNHQVWDMRSSGPELPLRLLSVLNGLVAQNSAHKAFNSRRLHLLGIVRWTLDLLLEASELYTLGEIAAATEKSQSEDDAHSDSPSRPGRGQELNNSASPMAIAAFNNGWRCHAPSVESTSVGGDPDNLLLQGCKTLLRRVLTFMLTPGDLEAIAEAAIYTVSITTTGKSGGNSQRQSPMRQGDDLENTEDEKLMPGPVARVYLLRLIEELVVDGVNEIVASGMEKKGESDGQGDPTVQPHAGGGASTGESYLTTTMMRGRQRNNGSEDYMHPKHQQAQAFLNAFAGVLSPVWFACLLEGCHEEASASAVLRLMILMLQSSPMFSEAFEEAGGFAPLVLSIPKFSTCPSITMSMLSQLLHAPILHLPCFGTLESSQLREVFDAEKDTTEMVMRESIQGGARRSSDPSCGIFALLAECLGRNIQLAPFDNDLGQKARETNEAVLQLLSHRHRYSPAFQDFCRTPDFLEPLAQALCLVHDEKLQRMQAQKEGNVGEVSGTFTPELQQGVVKRMKRRGSLAEVPKNESATERFVGSPEEETGSSGIGMVQLLRLVVSHAVLSGPLAAPLVSALFRSFPIHASPEQVEAFHLVLIEHCKSVVEDALQRGDPVALANCIGVSSVLLDRLMAGFFTSEPVLEAVNIILATLGSLSSSGSYASRNLGNAELSMLAADAAHIARLTCLTALQRSRPIGPYDEGDEDLKTAVLDAIRANLQSLLIVPPASAQAPRRQSIMPGAGNIAFSPPPSNSRQYPLWQSASLARCSQSNVQCTYPDLSIMEEPDRAFVVALMDEIHSLLFDPRDELKEYAVSIIVSLLQHRRTVMSEILIAEVQRGDRVETIDIMNRGGFGALLVAHEAASYAENISTVPRRSNSLSGSKKKHTAFFEWLERNQAQVEAVLGGIHLQATRLFPGLEMGAATPEDAIENEQKSMLLRLTSQDSSDRTILGGLERAELAQRCYDKTAESHLLWKRQGFDDLSSGGLQWKVLLRQLKGSCSIWEGGNWIDDDSPFSMKRIMSVLIPRTKEDATSDEIDEKKTAPTALVTKWKLDLTEGYERQRRRLLPNYEWYGLYGLAEGDSDEEVEDDGDNESQASDLGDLPEMVNRENSKRRVSEFFVTGESLEVAAEVLAQLKVRKRNNSENDGEGDDYYDDDENETDASTIISSSTMGESDTYSESRAGQGETKAAMDTTPTIQEGQVREDNLERGDEDEDGDENDNVGASSFDLITGLLNPGDWPEKAYNVQRCMGLEVVKALLLWCRGAIYIIDGFELTEGEGLEGKIERVQKEQSTFYINLRSKKEKGNSGRVTSDQNKMKDAEQDDSDEVTYHQRSHRIPFTELYSVFQRRYQLQNVALEFFDVNHCGTLVAFNTTSEREEVLTKVLNSSLPNSIFSSSYGTSINYKKFMSNWKSKVITLWVNRKITNFELIMHMNSFAGRSYNDLTQYPVFPWIIADYESKELDLDDPKTFRDLSKPMGGQNEERAEQFREKYREYKDSGMEPAHYGTHYSCAAYVLYYLMRLEPFSRLALRLQGGRFDVADRLFHNLGSSWRSASAENQQDVRELIPEFFYFSEFLVNTNGFDYGVTQTGKTIHDVTLPKWAKGSPERFIRLNRQALESEHVSKNLNHWIDLVFGFKQRGREAIAALNVFPHYSYEGNIDIDSLDDPILRESAIQSAQNFGQTPKCIERRPFQQRTVVQILRDKSIDFGALTYVATLTPPFCIVGAPQRVYIRPTMTDTCKVGMQGQSDPSVGDLCLVKGQLVGIGRTCALIIPQKKYYRFGGPNNGVSVHVAVPSSRHRELNKMLSIHDCMHRAPISAAKASLNGRWLVTGCVDSTVRVWRHDEQSIELRATLSGHQGGYITCIDVSTVFGTIVTGCSHGNVLLWDLRTLTFMRKLRHPFKDEADKSPVPIALEPVVSVSINHKNGNVVTLVGSHLSIFDINANLLACIGPGREYQIQNRPTCAVSTDCPDWMEQGIAAITGHVGGDILMWGIDYDNKCWKLRHIMPDKPHSCAITALRVADDKQDTLLVGDESGKMSVCKTLHLENLNQQELTVVAEELRTGVHESDFYLAKKSMSTESHNWIGYVTGAD
mmetsp:Transcript_30241/g.46140  ORF Transcript_30241/g.46140 Transcript_30241/m.46140 type:complete len:3721 (-) Transcript_30241:46-11208(-)